MKKNQLAVLQEINKLARSQFIFKKFKELVFKSVFLKNELGLYQLRLKDLINSIESDQNVILSSRSQKERVIDKLNAKLLKLSNSKFLREKNKSRNFLQVNNFDRKFSSLDQIPF